MLENQLASPNTSNSAGSRRNIRPIKNGLNTDKYSGKADLTWVAYGNSVSPGMRVNTTEVYINSSRGTSASKVPVEVRPCRIQLHAHAYGASVLQMVASVPGGIYGKSVFIFHSVLPPPSPLPFHELLFFAICT